MQLALWTAAQCNNSHCKFPISCTSEQLGLVWGGSPCNVKERGGADLSCFLICHMERCLLAAITHVLFLERLIFYHHFSTCCLIGGRQLTFLLFLGNVAQALFKQASSCVPQVNLAQPAEAIHNWIRGHDKVPGAWTVIDGQVCFPEWLSKDSTKHSGCILKSSLGLSSVCDPLWLLHAGGVCARGPAAGHRGGFSGCSCRQKRARPVWDWRQSCEWPDKTNNWESELRECVGASISYQTVNSNNSNTADWIKCTASTPCFIFTVCATAPSEEPAVWRWENDSCFQIFLFRRKRQCGADRWREDDGRGDQGKWAPVSSVFISQ